MMADPPEVEMFDAQLIRTLVFVGGHDRDRIRLLAASGVDAICIDLEDSTPLVDKARSREQFREIAAEIASMGPLVFARTNMPAAGMEEDLAAVMCPQLHCISLPKVEAGTAVADFDERVAASEAARGLNPGSLLIRPIIETCLLYTSDAADE